MEIFNTMYTSNSMTRYDWVYCRYCLYFFFPFEIFVKSLDGPNVCGMDYQPTCTTRGAGTAALRPSNILARVCVIDDVREKRLLH